MDFKGHFSERPAMVSVHQLLWLSHDPLSPTPTTSSAMKTSENAEEDPDNTEPADGDIQKEDFSAWLYSPSTGAVTKNYV